LSRLSAATSQASENSALLSKLRHPINRGRLCRIIDAVIAKAEQSEADRIASEMAERARLYADAERAKCVTLAGFIREAWPILEPGRTYKHGWHIDAVCEHLEAVTDGWIDRLVINIPPASMKSLLVSVFWPAWEWGPRALPHLRYLTGSYELGLSVRDNLRMRRLVESEWYQRLWERASGLRRIRTQRLSSRTRRRAAGRRAPLRQ
jgi:hypothetical protein